MIFETRIRMHSRFASKLKQERLVQTQISNVPYKFALCVFLAEIIKCSLNLSEGCACFV